MKKDGLKTDFAVFLLA